MRVDMTVPERFVLPELLEDEGEIQLWPRPLALPLRRSSQKPQDSSEAALNAKIKGLRDENDKLKQEMYALRDKQRSNHGRLEILREQGGYQRQALREQTREIAEVISVVGEVFLEYEDWVQRSMGFGVSSPRMEPPSS